MTNIVVGGNRNNPYSVSLCQWEREVPGFAKADISSILSRTSEPMKSKNILASDKGPASVDCTLLVPGS